MRQLTELDNTHNHINVTTESTAASLPSMLPVRIVGNSQAASNPGQLVFEVDCSGKNAGPMPGKPPPSLPPAPPATTTVDPP